MSKFCVFCGSKPEGKTKEHVVPRWLIQMTGNPKRQARFGLVKTHSGIEERSHSFDQFTFPACEACNNEFANMEDQVKPIIERILTCGDITAEELSLIMDWLDKVRVGVWLGMVILDRAQLRKNPLLRVEPNFHIKDRIGRFDRGLIIERFMSSQKRLCIGGAESFSFLLTPSAFNLTINNMCFTSISSVFMVARRLGFPYPTRSFLKPGRDEIGFNIVDGRERVMNPIIRRNVKEVGHIFYQPMFSNDLGDGNMEEYNSLYVTKHSIDPKKGKGNIFEQLEGAHYEYSESDEIKIKPRKVYHEKEFAVRSLINIYEWQNWVADLHKPDTSSLSTDQKRFIKQRFNLGKRYNKRMIQHYRKML